MKRSCVCLECRTALAEGEVCDGGGRHRVANLATVKGRKALVDEVWGPPSARRRARELARAGSAGAGAGTLGQISDCGGCTGCEVPSGTGDLGELLIFVAIVLAAALVAVLLFWLVKALVRFVRIKMNEPRAKGALLAPAMFPSGSGLRGRVVGEATLDAPVGGRRCVAWALDLVETRFFGRAIMLRDALTSGFDVILDDGRKVRIPEGRLRLHSPRAWVARERAIDLSTYGYGPALDEASARSSSELARAEDEADKRDEFLPIPFDEVGIATLAPGDVVELDPALDVIADPGGAQGYREAALVLAPRGIPRVRLCERQS